MFFNHTIIKRVFALTALLLIVFVYGAKMLHTHGEADCEGAKTFIALSDKQVLHETNNANTLCAVCHFDFFKDTDTAPAAVVSANAFHFSNPLVAVPQFYNTLIGLQSALRGPPVNA